MNRITWIDYMKGIAIFFVVLSHSEGVPKWLEYSFRAIFLTSFFFASGYLFHNQLKTFDIKKKILRITEGILIPYLIYWITSFIVDKSLEGCSIVNIINEFIYSLLEGKKLWFISCLLCAELLMSFNLYISRSPIYIFISGIVSFLVWKITDFSQPGVWCWCINVAFLAYLYLALGYSFKVYEPYVSKYLIKNKTGIVLFFCYVTLVYIDYQHFNYNVSFALNWFSNIWYYLLCSLVGLGFLYYLYNRLKENNVIIFLSLNSMLIYFYHNQMLNILKYASRLNIFDTVPEWGICIFQSVGTMLLVYIPIVITNKYLPILSGKSKWLSRKIA